MSIKKKTALITGVLGQDGAYLAELLTNKGYEVFGTTRRLKNAHLTNLNRLEVADKINLVELDIRDQKKFTDLLKETKPIEIYNLAAQSSVSKSWKEPQLTSEINALSVANMLQSIKEYSSETRFYQASSSEMFGGVEEIAKNENSRFYPKSPYGVSKAFAHWMTINYRESFGLHASSGILFNHESPLRATNFVTRKITYGLARIKLGLQSHIELGNLDVKRDWGFAGDYVKGMWLMLQQDQGGDFVLATGIAHSIRDFINHTAETLGISITWKGHGLQEVGLNAQGKVIVSVNKDFFRPTDVVASIGDASKAKDVLGWNTSKSISSLAEMMVLADLEILGKGMV